MAVAAGFALGLSAIYIGYRLAGTWDVFIESRKWHYQDHDMPWVSRGVENVYDEQRLDSARDRGAIGHVAVSF